MIAPVENANQSYRRRIIMSRPISKRRKSDSCRLPEGLGRHEPWKMATATKRALRSRHVEYIGRRCLWHDLLRAPRPAPRGIVGKNSREAVGKPLAPPLPGPSSQAAREAGPFFLGAAAFFCFVFFFFFFLRSISATAAIDFSDPALLETAPLRAHAAGYSRVKRPDAMGEPTLPPKLPPR